MIDYSDNLIPCGLNRDSLNKDVLNYILINFVRKFNQKEVSFGGDYIVHKNLRNGREANILNIFVSDASLFMSAVELLSMVMCELNDSSAIESFRSDEDFVECKSVCTMHRVNGYGSLIVSIERRNDSLGFEEVISGCDYISIESVPKQIASKLLLVKNDIGLDSVLALYDVYAINAENSIDINVLTKYLNKEDWIDRKGTLNEDVIDVVGILKHSLKTIYKHRYEALQLHRFKSKEHLSIPSFDDVADCSARIFRLLFLEDTWK